MGGDDEDAEPSLAERVLKMENKHDAFNVYLNYSAAGIAESGSGDDKVGFRCKQLRLEIKGNLTEHIYYRLRHRLNKASEAAGGDNFAKATDDMMVGYRFSDKWEVQAGKMFPYWGGFEYDTNPMYIYQYSDMVDNHDSPKAGFVALYKPVPTQEFVVEVCNARNDKLETAFPGIAAQGVRDARAPLDYIVNWNGNFANRRLQTRWACGLRTLAKDTYSRHLALGQKLNLPKLQCYVDYYWESADIDRLGVITREAAHLLPAGQKHAENVVYHTVVTKADWQFATRWNAFAKAAYETASVVKGVAALHNYRKHYSYLAGVEFYPDKSQDFRVSLSCIGQSLRYTGESTLENRDEGRVEIGMMYRIKCF